MEQFKTAAAQWQTEAERRIKVGQHRVDEAEARANQAETAASMDRVRSQEVESLRTSSGMTMDELQKLQACIRTIAQQFFEARNRARARAQVPDDVNLPAAGNFQSDHNTSADDDLETPNVDLLGTGYIASILDLAPAELKDIMGAVGGTSSTVVDEGAHEFNNELDRVLNSPLDESGLRNPLLSLVDERVNYEGNLTFLRA